MTDTFFEGPEKKVEIAVRGLDRSLRDYPEQTWRDLVQLARAEVLSVSRGPEADAYLLSESSLVVLEDAVMLITCGQTELVTAAERLLDMFPGEQLAYLFYERKNEHHPELQRTSFAEDVARLHRKRPGEAFRFGASESSHVDIFHIAGDPVFSPTAEDSTLEVLMHGPSRARCALFDRHSADDPLLTTGLLDQLSAYTIDAHHFEPQGYSMNALSQDHYATLHVTPQPYGSYVSFETNEPLEADVPERWIAALDRAFEPKSLDVLTFHPSREISPTLPTLTLRQRVAARLGAYQVTYTHLFRPCGGSAAPTRITL